MTIVPRQSGEALPALAGLVLDVAGSGARWGGAALGCPGQLPPVPGPGHRGRHVGDDYCHPDEPQPVRPVATAPVVHDELGEDRELYPIIFVLSLIRNIRNMSFFLFI